MARAARGGLELLPTMSQRLQPAYRVRNTSAPKEDGGHSGKVSAKGRSIPCPASKVRRMFAYDDERKSVAFEGKGIDRKGASRGKMTMTCMLQPAGQTTAIVVDFRRSALRLDRTVSVAPGLIAEIANSLISDLRQKNAEGSLSTRATRRKRMRRPSCRPAARPIGGMGVVFWRPSRAWLNPGFAPIT